ncbi:MAG: restriction endonuclease [Saprospiraceae bacterium]|nr:restriction endonuclease [Saprospiraceae bacterium]
MKQRSKNHFTVFEHQSLWTGRGNRQLSSKQLEILQQFHEEKGAMFYDLINNGVRFNQYVGVLQIGELTIEILPKIDRYSNEKNWRDILIGMLRAVGAFKIHAPSSSALSIKNNFILDLYFELFLNEVRYLFNQGLIKKYRKQESNQFSLKGSLKFGQHLQKNLVHQERFYVKHTVYDKRHQLHQILYKTLLLLKRINTNVHLNSQIGSLLLDFPELSDLKVTAATFEKITLNRKTAAYEPALEIAKLLLLNYHPDLKNGQNNVLALMFDMNLLWERFIYVSLRKQLPEGITITAQTQKPFWQSNKGSTSSMKPDIVITFNNSENIVLDTKWKNIGSDNPSPNDLRQLYVYHEYYQAKQVALVYPGQKNTAAIGQYFNKNERILSSKKCAVLTISTDDNIERWQKEIADFVFNQWLKLPL